MLLASRLLEACDLHAAIETGTYLGDSALALTTVAHDVWSIELSPELHRAAQSRFAEQSNIHLVKGSSSVVLPTVLEAAAGPALFWLDGHWSGGLTAGAESECPVLEEIERIDAWQYASMSCILIDDARLFLGPPPPPHDRAKWPAFIDVVDTLRRVHRRHVTVLDDVILAVPPAARATVDDYWLQVQAGEAQEMS